MVDYTNEDKLTQGEEFEGFIIRPFEDTSRGKMRTFTLGGKQCKLLVSGRYINQSEMWKISEILGKKFLDPTKKLPQLENVDTEEMYPSSEIMVGYYNTWIKSKRLLSYEGMHPVLFLLPLFQYQEFQRTYTNMISSIPNHKFADDDVTATITESLTSSKAQVQAKKLNSLEMRAMAYIVAVCAAKTGVMDPQAFVDSRINVIKKMYGEKHLGQDWFKAFPVKESINFFVRHPTARGVFVHFVLDHSAEPELDAAKVLYKGFQLGPVKLIEDMLKGDIYPAFFEPEFKTSIKLFRDMRDTAMKEYGKDYDYHKLLDDDNQYHMTIKLIYVLYWCAYHIVLSKEDKKVRILMKQTPFNENYWAP